MTTLGETAPGSGHAPDEKSLIRLCSISKVFTTDVLVQLVSEKKLRLEDPLQRFAPQGCKVPTKALRGRTGRPIELLDLATHTSGVPREIGQPPQGTPHFTYPNFDQRWAWLPRIRLMTLPGTAALYSNVAFDFLADALQAAAQVPYPVLLERRILKPLGMRDTTFEPTPEQCRHLLRGPKDEGPCTSTVATAGSSGLYSTPADITRWMRYLLGDTSMGLRRNAAAQMICLLPAQLTSVTGLNHAGKPTGIGLGWLRLGTAGSPSMILQKTGSGAGFTTYVAFTPAEHTAIFLAFMEGPKDLGNGQGNPLAVANNMLLALSNLPPMPASAYEHPAKKKRTRRSVKST